MSFKENGNLHGEIKNVRLLKEVSHSLRMFVCFRVCLIHIVANQSVFSQASLQFTVMKAYLVVVVAPCLCAVCTRPSSPEERDKDRAS